MGSTRLHPLSFPSCSSLPRIVAELDALQAEVKALKGMPAHRTATVHMSL